MSTPICPECSEPTKLKLYGPFFAESGRAFYRYAWECVKHHWRGPMGEAESEKDFLKKEAEQREAEQRTNFFKRNQSFYGSWPKKRVKEMDSTPPTTLAYLLPLNTVNSSHQIYSVECQEVIDFYEGIPGFGGIDNPGATGKPMKIDVRRVYTKGEFNDEERPFIHVYYQSEGSHTAYLRLGAMPMYPLCALVVI